MNVNLLSAKIPLPTCASFSLWPSAIWSNAGNQLVTIVKDKTRLMLLTGGVFALFLIGLKACIRLKAYCHYRRDQEIDQSVQQIGAAWKKRVDPDWQSPGIESFFPPIRRFWHKRGALSQGFYQSGQLVDTDRTLSGPGWIPVKINLGSANLTDDHLRKMAQSGDFSDVEELILSDNPQITGYGLAWIAKQGFENLTRLELSENKQVLRRGLDEWLAQDGLKKLSMLDLAGTDMREDILEKMIERAEWVRRLEGLCISASPQLYKLPSNISKLTSLTEHRVTKSITLSGGPVYFHGGLVYTVCENLKTHIGEEVLLVKVGKAWGSGRLAGITPDCPPNVTNLPALCKIAKVTFQEVLSGRCDGQNLNLSDCRLTDQELMLLVSEGGLERCTTIDLSQNPQLTFSKSSWIDKIRPGQVVSLDLSESGLSDQSLLEMGESDYFSNLHTLMIQNTRVTEKGLARIARGGFSSLRILDIGRNPRLLGEGLNEWVQEEGFKTLQALGLSNIWLTQDCLKEIIDSSPWFKGLAGLDVSCNARLHELPANISKLQHLDTPSVGHGFQGRGLFVSVDDQFRVTEELRALDRQQKVRLLKTV